MPIYKGALAQLLLQIEAAFRTAPAAAAFRVPITEYDVQRDARRVANNTITSRPGPNKTDPGDPIIGGTFSSILDLRSIGWWLKLLYGAATTGKAVTKQPTTVTGVTLQYGLATNTAGDGTLAFLIAGTTLSWKTQGGTTGAPQDVSGGGTFSLESGGGGKNLIVTVDAASLPVGNASDTDIAVSSTLKAHAFPFNLTDRPSALLEEGHTDLAKYYRSLGMKLKKLSWDAMALEQNIAGELIGAVETEENAVFDAAPTSYTALRACAGKGYVWNGIGAGALGTITGATLEVINEMEGVPCADALEGYGYIDQGDSMIQGTLRTVWKSGTLYDLARAGTSTRLRIEQAAVSGADTFKLIHDIPQIEMVERRPPIRGKSGLVADVSWKQHNAASAPIIVLVNDVASF